MNDCQLIIIAALLIAISGFVVLVSTQFQPLLTRISVTLHVIGSAIGVVTTLRVVFSGLSSTISFSLPFWGQVTFMIDPLAAFFQTPVFLVSAVGAVYEIGYCAQHEAARFIRVFFGLMCGALALVFCSQHGILFLFFWEIMALSAFFLVASEDRRKEARDASWIYLACTHCSTLTLFAFFALIKYYTGSFLLSAETMQRLSSHQATVLFLLALFGFGFKAGVFPLHFWLPPAHAAAPSHVSAILSGVLLKVGIYGIVRTLQILPTPPLWWGILILSLGAVSSLLGVMYAIGQHDFKRLLAYHSIENIGIILLGFGLATVGVSTSSPLLVALGFAGGMLHVLNHALFKSLLFFGAGAVVHATHTRNLDRLGGLIKYMPITALCFLVGAVAIVGLPPLNGFISELSVYLGLFHLSGQGSGVTAIFAVLCIVALCLTGAFALACFVKVFGCVFLGEYRGTPSADLHEPPLTMWFGPLILATCCLAIGLFPRLLLPQLEVIAALWSPAHPAVTTLLGSEFPFSAVTGIGLVLCLLFTAVYPLWRRGPARRDLPTWDCGYLFGTPRIQYTASSFAQLLVDAFHPLVPSQANKVEITKPFSHSVGYESHVADMSLDLIVRPFIAGSVWLALRLRVLQSGHSQLYILYVILTLVVFFLVR